MFTLILRRYISAAKFITSLHDHGYWHDFYQGMGPKMGLEIEKATCFCYECNREAINFKIQWSKAPCPYSDAHVHGLI